MKKDKMGEPNSNDPVEFLYSQIDVYRINSFANTMHNHNIMVEMLIPQTGLGS